MPVKVKGLVRSIKMKKEKFQFLITCIPVSLNTLMNSYCLQFLPGLHGKLLSTQHLRILRPSHFRLYLAYSRLHLAHPRLHLAHSWLHLAHSGRRLSHSKSTPNGPFASSASGRTAVFFPLRILLAIRGDHDILCPAGYRRMQDDKNGLGKGHNDES